MKGLEIAEGAQLVQGVRRMVLQSRISVMRWVMRFVLVENAYLSGEYGHFPPEDERIFACVRTLFEWATNYISHKL